MIAAYGLKQTDLGPEEERSLWERKSCRFRYESTLANAARTLSA